MQLQPSRFLTPLGRPEHRERPDSVNSQEQRLLNTHGLNSKLAIELEAQ
jgi:hypothetical protein